MVMVRSASIQKSIVTACIAMAIVAARPGHAQESVTLRADLPTVINANTGHGSNPDIAASLDGKHIYVIWEGKSKGNRRIFLRESFDGVWLPEIIIDADPSADNMNPSIAVDINGRPHVAWIATVAGRRVPMYAHRAGRQPLSRWNIHELLPREYPEVGDCDFISLKSDENGSPWIVWQSGFGSAYSIFAAHPGKGGKALQLTELTPLAVGPNLYPEILLSDAPIIVWYSATDSPVASSEPRYALAGKKYDAKLGSWAPYVPQDFDLIDANALPFIVQKPNDDLAAFWYTNSHGDQEFPENNDRILLGEQGPESRGYGKIIDSLPMRHNREITAVIDQSNYMAVWTAQTADGFSDIMAAYGNGDRSFDSLSLTPDESSQVYSSPQIEKLSSNEFAVVWQTEYTGATDDGAIYFTRVNQ